MELIREDFMELIRKDFIRGKEIKGLRLKSSEIKGLRLIKALRLNSKEIKGSRLKSRRHQSVHLYLDNTYYFLTSHTYKNIVRLSSDKYKMLLFEKIKTWLESYEYKLLAWVILDNHYHILFETKKGDDLPKIVARIHTGFSYEVNKFEHKPGRKIWQNYWDRCIRSEKDLWRYFNYIHQNPVKHSHANRMEDYKFSSYNMLVEKKGIDWMNSIFQNYPIIDFTVKNDEES